MPAPSTNVARASCPFFFPVLAECRESIWIFQTYLKPGERREEAIVFQSKRPFPREHMPLELVTSECDRDSRTTELRNCDEFLRFGVTFP